MGGIQKERRVAKCPFCFLAARLGRTEKAGILECMVRVDLPLPSAGMGEQYCLNYEQSGGVRKEPAYKCALGKEGKDCVLPHIYSRT